jgi:NADPH:quinone reductase-like Zn-dependent oxidoreductase
MKLRYKISLGVLALLAVAIVSLALVLSRTSPCGPAPALAGDAQTMKAAIHRCYGPPDIISVEDVEKPVPADDEVLIRVRAAAVNPLDWHYMRGSPYIMRLMSGMGAPDDIRMGVDFAGIVESVGKDVTRFGPGDEVFGGSSGAFAEYVIIREDRALALKPANVTFEQAAAVPIAAVTALQALRDKGQLQPGQKVLINGASGGVGTFAVQIARSMGAEVSGVCSTRNVEMVRSLGADHVFDYKKEDYTESGQTFDLIVDMVGNHTPLANTRLLSPEGTLVLVGGPKGNWIAPMIRPLQSAVFSPFVDQEMVTLLAEMNQEDMATLAGLMQSGQVTPVIDRRFPLREIADAIRYSESGRARGKIIVSPDS